MWQIKYVISPIAENLWAPNYASADLLLETPIIKATRPFDPCKHLSWGALQQYLMA